MPDAATLPLEASENIVHIVDNYLKIVSGRKLVSGDEITDILLDIRSFATKGYET